jgi:hypothetical protein
MTMSLATGVAFAGSFYGTSENDFLPAGLGDDEIYGYEGDDVIYAAEGTYLSSTERSTAAKATISS